ncbi:MAG: DUF1800 domain-containing protein [Saprospiraceae bacterium]
MANFRFVLFYVFLTTLSLSSAQKIILGGGNSPQITTKSSSNWQPLKWPDSASSDRTINAHGLNAPLYEASRFLYQATLGSNKAEIERVANIGMKAWIDEQKNLKPSYISDELVKVIKEVVDWHYLNGGDSMDAPQYFYALYYNYSWWNMNLKNKDKLRQRVAFALSELLVVSANSDIGGYANAMASYYDLLIKHSFGNYYDLLHDVTYHPAMGVYLSHLNNPATDTAKNLRPDENYAREIMQLFSIGLFELNNDGTIKKDSRGNAIPTYTQKDIQELAKIFTGMSFSKLTMDRLGGQDTFGNATLYLGDPTKPMKLYEKFHERGSKTLFGTHITKWPQTGDEDIEEALHILFNHPNVGPFVCKQLIQRLIKSNPSSSYVGRVAKVFNDDGKGVRGNLGAVIEAILLDDEARSCEWLEEEFNGQLREPIVKYSHFVNAVGVTQYYDRFFNSSYDFADNTGQIALHAPSVFNFFTPGYQAKGGIADNNLVSPEFQILNSKTSIGFMNMVNNWIYDYVLYSWMDKDPATVLQIDELKNLAKDPEVLINRLDLILTHGNMTPETRGIIKTEIVKFTAGDYRDQRVRLALYLTMISPDYAIFK